MRQILGQMSLQCITFNCLLTFQLLFWCWIQQVIISFCLPLLSFIIALIFLLFFITFTTYLINLDTPLQMFTFVGGVLISKEIAHIWVPGNFSLNFYFVQNLSHFKLLHWVDIPYFLCVLCLLHFISLKVFFMTYKITSLIRGKMSDKMCTCQE